MVVFTFKKVQSWTPVILMGLLGIFRGSGFAFLVEFVALCTQNGNMFLFHKAECRYTVSLLVFKEKIQTHWTLGPK